MKYVYYVYGGRLGNLPPLHFALNITVQAMLSFLLCLTGMIICRVWFANMPVMEPTSQNHFIILQFEIASLNHLLFVLLIWQAGI